MLFDIWGRLASTGNETNLDACRAMLY